MQHAMHHRAQVATASGLDILAAIWLLISPFVLGFRYVASATTNDVIFGIIIGILAAIRFFGAYAASSLSWINAVLGLWILVSPWVLQYSYSAVATWNSVIVGIIIIVLASWSALATDTSRENRTDIGQM